MTCRNGCTRVKKSHPKAKVQTSETVKRTGKHWHKKLCPNCASK